MPAQLFKTPNRTVTLDARPDRPDIRDRIYQPPLKSLPHEYPERKFIRDHFERYVKAGLVLDQGSEGACTGFGLAAVINYLLYRQTVDAKTQPPKRVSERMIYHLARKYDEWPGEDYEGSSCRGAVKGWFHHGVCDSDLWPYRDKTGEVVFIPPIKDWDKDAAKRPVGAYYRIMTDAIADMQAAIAEVGAIYVSSDVHRGWDAVVNSSSSLPLIPWKRNAKSVGGHAYAFVGYDHEGFILQNSWGPKWGFRGFAKIAYDDWLENAGDAWVAVMGAPMAARAPAIVLSSRRTVPASMPELGAGLVNGATAAATLEVPADRKNTWNTVEAFEHSVILGNDGLPDHVTIEDKDADAAVERACYTLPKDWLKTPKHGGRRIAIYAHGGLNDLSAGIARAKVMGPWFKQNGVYPIFVVWQSGYADSVKNIIADQINDLIRQARDRRTASLFERISDARDYLIEKVAIPAARPVWSQMKQNAEAASGGNGGMVQIAKSLQRLSADVDNLEIHLVGHSAGAVLLGAFLKQIEDKKLFAKTLSLYAPACTVGFANSRFVPAAANNIFDPKKFYVDILSDENERADSVGPYGKSLLYLVSRALEPLHKTPILGIEAAWEAKFDKDAVFVSDQDRPDKPHSDLVAWRKAWRQMGGTMETLTDKRVIEDKRDKNKAEGTIKSVHGCFDNWIDGVERTMKRILGTSKLPSPIDSLKGF